MANALYLKYKEALLAGEENTSLLAGTVKVALIDTDLYTFAPEHQFMTDLAGVIGQAQEIEAGHHVAGDNPEAAIATIRPFINSLEQA